MKYLKKYNEELNSPESYRRAARKILKNYLPETNPKEIRDLMSHDSKKPEKISDENWNRVEKLKGHANSIEKANYMKKWTEKLQKYSIYGTYKLKIRNPLTKKELEGDFATQIIFDYDYFQDETLWTIEGEQNKAKNRTYDINNLSMGFSVSIIPTSEDLIQECESVMPIFDFYSGSFSAFFVKFNFNISNITSLEDGTNKSGDLNITDISIGAFDPSVTGNLSFVSKKELKQFLRSFATLLTDRSKNYPSGYSDQDNFYSKIEQLVEVSHSFSSDYGFAVSDLGNFITKNLNTGLAEKIMADLELKYYK